MDEERGFKKVLRSHSGGRGGWAMRRCRGEATKRHALTCSADVEPKNQYCFRIHHIIPQRIDCNSTSHCLEFMNSLSDGNNCPLLSKPCNACKTCIVFSYV